MHLRSVDKVCSLFLFTFCFFTHEFPLTSARKFSNIVCFVVSQVGASASPPRAAPLRSFFRCPLPLRASTSCSPRSTCPTCPAQCLGKSTRRHSCRRVLLNIFHWWKGALVLFWRGREQGLNFMENFLTLSSSSF